MATYNDNRAANEESGANVGLVIAVLLLILLAAWALFQFFGNQTALPASSTAGSTTSVTTGAATGTSSPTPTTNPLIPSTTSGASTR